MASNNSYSRLDRLLHHIAFRGINAQKSLADIEDRLFEKQLHDIRVESPVFITSLPRAGTTLLLDVLTKIPEFAFHTYRDMPFLLCPLFWQKISQGWRKESVMSERAHGDGMEIGYDSPEAFEEIIWKTFWKNRYQSDRIIPWLKKDRNEEFELFFRNHIRKVVTLRSNQNVPGRRLRYISKNNANVSRLEYIGKLFPDSKIIIPVRNPWDHCASMYRQHLRFLEIHAIDAFGRQYMEWLGHHEFGAVLRPINFQQWLDDDAILNPAKYDFWLNYWLVTYQYVLKVAGSSAIFVDYDKLCLEPKRSLQALSSVLHLTHGGDLLTQASRFRPATSYDDIKQSSSGMLEDMIRETYESIKSRSL